MPQHDGRGLGAPHPPHSQVPQHHQQHPRCSHPYHNQLVGPTEGGWLLGNPTTWTLTRSADRGGGEEAFTAVSPRGWPPQLYNWNSVRWNYYLPPSTLSSHAPPPSPRHSACAWLTNLSVHSLPPSFTRYTGYEGQRLRDESLSICCIILGFTLPTPSPTPRHKHKLLRLECFDRRPQNLES